MRLFWGLLALVLLVGCRGCDDLGQPLHPNCGNGVVDGLETCDGTALDGQTCRSQGFAGGALTCAQGCGGFIFASCEGVPNAVDPCELCGATEECRAGRCESVCDGEPFTELENNVSFDITTVQLRGAVTMGGLPPSHAGTLTLTGTVWWEPLVVDVGADGSFSAAIEPGSYRVMWDSDGPVAAERLPDLVVDADTELDLDLTPWTDIDLTVTSDFPGEMGSVVFEHLDPRFGRITAKIGDNGELGTVSLRPGDYRLWWSHDVDDFPVSEYLEQTTMAGLVDRGLVDIPVVSAELRVTMNGAPVQADGDVRVDIVRAGEVPRPSWNSTARDRETWTLDGDGRASGWLLDRPRDVALVVNGPPWWGWLWVSRGVDFGTDTTELDLTAPRLAGEVRRNGGRLPNAGIDGITRGRLEFSSDLGYVSTELDDRGPGDFAVRVPPGLWQVEVAGIVWAGVLPVVPWDSPTPISIDTDVDDYVIDVPAVRLAGQLTVNGMRPPDDLELETRASLQLRDPNGSTWFAIPIPPRGPAGWDVIVAPGHYQAELVRWWFATSGDPAPTGVLPLGRWVVGDIDASAATRRDVDVRLVEVTAHIEEHGEPARPGLLWFEDRLTDRLAREVETGDGPVTVTLYPGYYRALWAPLEEDGEVGDPVVVQRMLIVDDAVEQTWDVGLVNLHADLLVNGEPAVDAGDVDVQLARQPYANTSLSVPVAPTGPASFDVELINGRYNIVLEATPDHPTLPAHGVVLQYACTDSRLE